MRAHITTAILLLLLPMISGAYEVHILEGRGSESRTLEKGRYDLAIERLEQRLQYESSNRDIKLTNLCTAYVVVGDYEKATPVCNEAIEANGEFVGAAYNSRGVLNALTGDFISALADFEEAADTRNYKRPRSVFGDKMPSMRRFSTPEVDLERSIEIAAKNRSEADTVWVRVKD